MLKAILLDFNGVIIDDEIVHQELIADILLQENLRPTARDYQQCCLGRNDRACLRDLLSQRGRIVGDDYLDRLIARKAIAYQQYIERLPQLPIYPGLEAFLIHLQSKGLWIGLVTGALRQEAEGILQKARLAGYFQVLVGGDEISQSKPDPEGYLLAVDRLNQLYPQAAIAPSQCLAIEDTPAGIAAAKRAGMQVVGIAHTYPFHFMQRQANWAIDHFHDLEIDRIERRFALV
jgi:HAD superfamily hydrolase (TIGR01509 family)